MLPLIVTASICGREKTRECSPYFPATKDQVIADGIRSYHRGIPQLHIHARNNEGTYTYDPVIFGEILDAFRKECPRAILQISTGGTYTKVNELLIPLLKLKPDMATLALQPEEATNIALIKTFEEYGVKPIIECFSLDHARTAIKLMADGYVKGPMNLEFLYNDHRDIPFEEIASQLLEFSSMCQQQGNINWSTCKGLNKDPALHAMAIALGGHCRAGLEDRHLYADGSYVKASEDLLTSPIQMAEPLGRPLATYEQAKEILGL